MRKTIPSWLLAVTILSLGVIPGAGGCGGAAGEGEPALGSVSLEWTAATRIDGDPVSDSDITGYIIYYGLSPGDYLSMVPVGKVLQCTVDNLLAGETYYFTVAAVDLNGLESANAPECSLVVVEM